VLCSVSLADPLNATTDAICLFFVWGSPPRNRPSSASVNQLMQFRCSILRSETVVDIELSVSIDCLIDCVGLAHRSANRAQTHQMKKKQKNTIRQYIGCRWRHFVPYLCQFSFVAILSEKLLEMFVALIALKYALLVSQWSYGHFLKLTDTILFQ